jgi:hypothetical protein
MVAPRPGATNAAQPSAANDPAGDQAQMNQIMRQLGLG